MKFYKKVFLVLFYLLSFQLFAQPFGNEWINYNQKYFKIKVVNKGVYRIYYNALVQPAIEMGFNDLSSVNPRKFQMFHNGVEIPIYVSGEADGIFNINDFIEFYGMPNDGSLDKELYNSPNDQPQSSLSLYTDTSAYFLTFLSNASPNNGMRMTTFSFNDYNSLPALDYCLSEQKLNFYNHYNEGKSFLIGSDESKNPEYVQAEGVCSSPFGIGLNTGITQRIEKLNNKFLSPNGPDPILSYTVVGLNDNRFYNIDHRLFVGIGSTDASFTQLYDTSYNGYSIIKKSHILSRSDMGIENSFLNIEAKFINNVPYQAHAISEIKFQYPKQFNLDFKSIENFAVEPSVDNRHIEWINYPASKNKPIVYDLSSGKRIRAEKIAGNKVRFFLPSSTNITDCYIADSSDVVVLSDKFIEPAMSDVVLDKELLKFNPNNNKNRFKVTLLTNNSFVGDYTGKYLQYKQSYTTANLVTVQQLYNNFSYGVAHPIAIKRYIKFLLENGDTTLKHLFIVGRGFQNDHLRLNSIEHLNMVPTMGVPASDNMFASGINGSGLAPAIAIGRLTIDKPVQLGIYTQKLIDMENNADALWKKEVLHLGGGSEGNQAKDIRNRLNAISSHVTGAPFGGYVSTFSKSASGVNEPFLKQKAIDHVNSGKQLVTFLGHASSTVSDIDLGDTSEYNNFPRYPIYYFNGCSTGNPCLYPIVSSKLPSENSLKSNRKGGVAFIGQTSLTELSHVYTQMNEFYRLTFVKNYTNDYTVGDAVKDMLFNTQAQDELKKIHTRILFLQGDPSIKMYQPLKPDYAINNNSFFLFPKNLTSISDSFALAVIVENYGKYVTDSFNIKIDRTYPNDFLNVTYTFRAKGVKYRDTIFCYIKSKDVATSGDNKFFIHINYDQKTDESFYANNTGTYNGFIPGNGINLIYPKRYDIVSRLNNDTVELVAQALNIFETNNLFEFEIDTSHLFNSPWKKTQIVSNIVGQLKSYKTKLLGTRDSIVYYWRARLANQSSQTGGFYVERSFIHIFDNDEGWSQSHFPQFYPSSKLSRVVLDTLKRRFDFSLNSEYLYANCRLDPYPNYGIKKGGHNAQSYNIGAPFSGIICVAFDKNTLEQLQLPDIYNPSAFAFNSGTGQYDYLENVYKYYNFTIGFPSGNPQFPRWVDSLPDGTYVGICTRYGLNKATWTPEVTKAFEKLGARLPSIMSNNPHVSYAMIGRKGEAPGWAEEDTGVWYLNNDLSYVEIQKELIGKYNKGTVKSELIGPSNHFGGLYFHTKAMESASNDKFYINVHGVSNAGKDTILFNNVRKDAFDLSSVDTKKFPYLYLEGVFEDIKTYTPPQLKHWRVTSFELPEGTLSTQRSNEVWRDSLKQGEQFKYALSFENISTKSFANNLRFSVKVFNIDTKDTVYDSVYVYTDSLRPGKFFTVNTNFYTNKFRGRYAYFVKVNFDANNKAEIPELTLSNNAAIRYFEIIEDKINPLLDVTINGKHISNGEIVSANPTIVISSKDENTYSWQTDTSGIKIWLKRPNSSTFEAIDFATYNVKFFPATDNNNIAKAEFSPKNLPDGIYTLKVQSNDMNDNKAGNREYQINFQVVNEQSATNFYPYPNPFTTNMRFVFTLTGNDVPDYINIKIMTIQGRVVKELNKEDLGNINIGNNITDVVWDGTDEYGDRLSNGVYLYTVTIKKDGKLITQISNDNVSNDLNEDKANNDLFKNYTGKIVLLR